jgi:hypothetical protein
VQIAGPAVFLGNILAQLQWLLRMISLERVMPGKDQQGF